MAESASTVLAPCVAPWLTLPVADSHSNGHGGEDVSCGLLGHPNNGISDGGTFAIEEPLP